MAALSCSEEILTNGTRVFVAPGFTFGTDGLLLARFCPDFIDSILYTAEELEILNYPL